jgi:Histidine kinase-, DNA gyrase B-, and HSP90-like ATPase
MNLKIGKDVIESLTLGMYDDSRFIFREYLQNSADQIDRAIEQGLLNSRRQGNIFVTITPIEKKIIIEDNATGIQSSKVFQILGNIALSEKDRDKEKGFRGIGRLGGLAYCETLTFESSYFGENLKSILKWDALELRKIINDRHLRIEAVQVIERITSFSTSEEDEDKHYFKVILENVNNYDLLDIQKVRDYLSMVAPLPFDNRFIFKQKIKDTFFSDYKFEIDEYNIFVNQEELYKAYTTSIYEKANGCKKKIDEIFDVKFFELNVNQVPIAIGWYGLSMTINQIPSINIARGFRLRKGNIQIGLDDTLRRFHKDSRFHFYYFGEIYALSKELIPNSRRDFFLENDTTRIFVTKLEDFFGSIIHRLTYDASAINSAKKKIEKFFEVKVEFDKKVQNGFTDKMEKETFEEDLKRKKEEAEKAKNSLQRYREKGDEDAILKKIYEKVVDENKVLIPIIEDETKDKTNYRTDKLSKLTKQERKLVSRVFGVIRRILTPDLAENLIVKIEDEFK